MEDGMPEYSSGAFDHILQQLSGNEEAQFDALDLLSNTLVYGDANILVDFPVLAVAQRLTNILKTSSRIKFKEMAALCMYHLLESHPGSTRALINSNALQVLDQALTSVDSLDLVQHCISALNVISKFRPEEIGEGIGISCFLRFIDFLCVAEQRTSIIALQRVTESYFKPNFTQSLPQLVGLILNPDEKIQSVAAQAFSNIATQAHPDTIPPDAGIKLAETIPRLADGALIVRLLRALTNMVNNPSIGMAISTNPQILETTLFCPNAKYRLRDVAFHVLKIILLLLPAPNPELPDYLWPVHSKTDSTSREFAIEIQPLLVNLILKRIPHEELTFVALASTNQIKQTPITPQFLVSILGYSQSPDFVAPIMAFLLTMKDLTPFTPTGIFHVIDATKINSKYKQYYQTNKKKLLTKANYKKPSKKSFFTFTKKTLPPIKNDDDIILFITNNEINIFDLLQSGAAEQIFQFICKPNYQPSLPLKEILPDFIKSILDALPFINIPEDIDPMHSVDIKTFEQFSYSVQIQAGKLKERVPCDMTIDFLALEAFVNQKLGKISDGAIINAMDRNPLLKRIIQPPNDNFLQSHVHVAYFARAFNVKHYTKYHFKVKNCIFNAHEPFFQCLTSTFPDMTAFAQSTPTIETIPGDCPRSQFKISLRAPPNLKSGLNLLNVLHHIMPNIPLESPDFGDQLLQRMNSPALTNGLASTGVSIIYNYPYLFSFDTRYKVFKLAAYDLLSAMYTTSLYYLARNQRTKLDAPYVKILINRNDLFNEGMMVLNAVGPGHMRFDVSFEGEAGLGFGPTQEFFRLLSREFCKSQRKLWRNDQPDKEFAWSEKGLFPSPDADKNMMKMLGLLIGKALNSHCLVDIPFNIAFLKMLRGRAVSIEEVDEQFARSLESPEGLIGLDYSYPGIPSLVLSKKPNEIVTEENIKQYIADVRNYTAGQPIRDLCKAFIEGFEQVMPFDALNLFRSDELQTIFCGDAKLSISRQDLDLYIDISHGYSKSAPQIGMLFDIIQELNNEDLCNFIMFITGSGRLPIGGLSALNPHLTIAKRTPDGNSSPDTCLPSVMTCMNYFKLPAYSTKEIMKEKLMYAIRECKNSFELT